MIPLRFMLLGTPAREDAAHAKQAERSLWASLKDAVAQEEQRRTHADKVLVRKHLKRVK